MSDKPHSQSPPPTASDAIQALLYSQLHKLAHYQSANLSRLFLAIQNMDIIGGKIPLVPGISPQPPKYLVCLAKCAASIWHICMKLAGNQTPRRLSNLAPVRQSHGRYAAYLGPHHANHGKLANPACRDKPATPHNSKTAHQGGVDCVV